MLIVPNCCLTIIAGVGTGGLGSKLAGKVGGAVGVAPPRHRLEPETDPVKLTTFLCGGNISREGGPDPELRPESEYPDWLWTLRTERGSPPLDELDPDTWDYWIKLQKYTTNRYYSILRMKHKYHRY